MRAADFVKVSRFARLSPRTVRAAALLALGCTLQGCGEGRPGGSARAASDAPAPIPVDSVVLAESDSSYVTEPNDVAVAPDGTFYIADRHAKRVHVFGRDGRYLRGLGRGGQGPGEFHNPGFLAFGGDSVLYVVDTSEIEVFDLRTFTHAGSHPMPRRPGTLGVSANRLFAGYADPERNGSVLRVAGNTAGPRVTGPLPELLKDAGLFPMVSAWLSP